MTRVILTNKYGEEICELEQVGNFYRIPRDFYFSPVDELLDIGDVFTVEEVWTEDEE